MRKNDIVKKISYDTGIQHEAVQLILESAALIVRDAIIRGERVVVAGFGSFFPIVCKAKKAQDMRKGITIDLPARRGVKYIPSKFIKQAFKKPLQEE